MADPMEVAPHPAKWSKSVLDAVAQIVMDEADRLGRPLRVLDPFAGIGLGELRDACRNDAAIVAGVELEPEWAAADDQVMVGDATALPEDWTGAFDAVITSPCLAQDQRVLTNDLRWVPAGDVTVGDRLLAFDEDGPGTTARGTASRRRWRRAEVVRSVPRSVDCVRVVLANGDEVVTTPEHPWLAYRYDYGGRTAAWVPSSELMGRQGRGVTKGHRAGHRQPFYVMRQVQPWAERRSYDAGWLAGMFDGEGSLSLGVHGAPKLQMSQVAGPVIDRAEMLMKEFGYAPNRIARRNTPAHRQEVHNLYVTDGFPGMLRALGELRPTRLLSKWAECEIESRTVQAERVQVVAVEPVGRLDIQEIETTTGTYIGEGYLHHNCYGNRLADHHEAKDDSTRVSYRHRLGRMPNGGSAAVMQWGPTYREFHGRAWDEARRVLRSGVYGTPGAGGVERTPGGIAVVNVSNHYRTRARGGRRVQEEQPVVEWHLNDWLYAGCTVEQVVKVPTPRMGFGTNGDARVDGERVLVLRMPDTTGGTLF